MRLSFHSKNKAVYHALLQSIITGESRPGERLVIDNLAIELSVSHIPIREALRQLEADGFVTIEPHVGATVTEINTSLVSEVFALLQAMEIISSRVACLQMSDDELKALGDLIDQMKSHLDDPTRWSQENKDLHLFICDCAKMPVIKKMMQKTLDHWDRLRLYYLKAVFADRIEIAQREHFEILKAFRTRNPNEVEKAIQRHNQAALAAYSNFLGMQPTPGVRNLAR
ncbi:MAG TPA: GntR family transcriptional regulator [Aggregatilineales bacterium]|nr:GntR family transcriptional regulator [Aggregatilineales bacterium]